MFIGSLGSTHALRRFSLTSTKVFVYTAGLVNCGTSELISGGQVSKSNLPRPTDAELAILNVLWRRGPSTVRHVLDELNRTQPTGYTTVLKMLQIMTEKGLVGRDESERTHIYRATLPEEETQKQLVSDLLERAFGGSARQLVLHALAVNQTSRKELAQIRQLLDQLEGSSK
jgi:BlaI family penicillinase repressor